MKKALLFLMAAAVCAGIFTSARAEGYPFSDVSPGESFYDGICYAYENGLMVGDGSGRFYPDRTLSRAELAEILYNLEGRPGTEGRAAFTDVPSDSWFSDAVVWAKSSGVMRGAPDGRFAPMGDVDMEQLAAALMRYAGDAPSAEEIGTEEALRWAAGIGIASERGSGEPVTRGQTAWFVKLFRENVTDIPAVGCTVWPMAELPVYSVPYGKEKIGVAQISGKFTVLDEKNGRFLIDNGDAVGYIDCVYCLIDLSDYLGDLCAYDIKNSYDAVYNVNGYGIPNVTGTVICGYEGVAEKDDAGEPERFAVPLLYPTAKKVARAAMKAREMGYRLKIYDAFRPKTASEYLYETTELALKKALPELPRDEMTDDQWREYVENAPDSAQMRDSLYFEMTRDDYDLNVFLAQNISAHNLGIAVDLTLERMDDGEELHMQTGMHDLSWRSFRSENGREARLLSDIMTSSGLAPLFSEWWHFQDDELRGRVPDLAPRADGVTV